MARNHGILPTFDPVNVYINPPANSTFTAGLATSQYSLMNLCPDFRVYPARFSDYAAQANVGNILAPTTSAYYGITPALAGNIAAQGADGAIYVLLSVTTGSNGLQMLKLSFLGALLASTTIEPNTAVGVSDCNIFFLSNGNLCVTFYESGGPRFAIYDPVTMLQVVAPTVMNIAGSPNCGSCALSGGGFAAVYNKSTTASELVIYNNAGVLQATVAIPSSDSSANAAPSVTELSNGNLLVVYFNSSFYYAIYSAAGAVIVSATSTGITQATSAAARVSAMAGYFAFAMLSASTTLSMAVFSNAGVQQGSTQTSSVWGTAPASNNSAGGIVNDGVNFWVVTLTSAASILFSKLSIAGVLTSYSAVATGLGAWALNVYYDSYDNLIITFGTNFSGTNALAFSPVTLSAVASSAPGTGYTNAVPLGDGAAFIAQVGSGSAFVYAIQKMINSAILGPAQASCAAVAPCSIDISNGYKQIVGLKGSLTKAFNHKSGTNIYGNSGVLVGTVSSQTGM